MSSFLKRASLVALAAGLLAGCGDPVTEAAREGGLQNPQPAPAPPVTPPVAPVAPPAAPASTPAAPSAAVLTPEGYGAVRIGMTDAEARAALGAGVQSDPADDPNACRHLWVGAAPANVVYMVEQGKVTRITAHLNSPVKTAEGLGVGSTEAQVRAAYGDTLEVEPHKYVDAPAKYLTRWTRPGERGVRYETDQQGIVREVHAGDQTIRYVEGCS